MICGNITAELQVQTSSGRNPIGETIKTWETKHNLLGFLDLSSGESKYTVYDAKIQESTHIFICDYTDLSDIAPETCRMVISGKVYAVMLIDDPMELHEHLEIYLKYAGGQ